MKLFALPDANVDRLDRAQWLTPPFDLAFTLTLLPGSGSIVKANARRKIDASERLTLKPNARSVIEHTPRVD